MTDTATQHEFAMMLARTSEFPRSIDPPKWCAICLAVLHRHGMQAVHTNERGNRVGTYFDNLNGLYIALRSIEQIENVEWYGLETIGGSTVRLLPTTIVNGTHLCEAHVGLFVKEWVK